MKKQASRLHSTTSKKIKAERRSWPSVWKTKRHIWLIELADGAKAKRVIWVSDYATTEDVIRDRVKARFGRFLPAKVSLLQAGEFNVVGPCLRCFTAARSFTVSSKKRRPVLPKDEA